MKMSEKLLIPSERKARFNGGNKREIPQIKQNSRINRNTYNRKMSHLHVESTQFDFCCVSCGCNEKFHKFLCFIFLSRYDICTIISS